MSTDGTDKSDQASTSSRFSGPPSARDSASIIGSIIGGNGSDSRTPSTGGGSIVSPAIGSDALRSGVSSSSTGPAGSLEGSGVQGSYISPASSLLGSGVPSSYTIPAGSLEGSYTSPASSLVGSGVPSSYTVPPGSSAGSVVPSNSIGSSATSSLVGGEIVRNEPLSTVEGSTISLLTASDVYNIVTSTSVCGGSVTSGSAMSMRTISEAGTDSTTTPREEVAASTSSPTKNQDLASGDSISILDTTDVIKRHKTVHEIFNTESDTSIISIPTNRGTSGEPYSNQIAVSLHWKKIYQTVTGYSRAVTDDVVGEVLNLVKTDLIKGLLYFESYSKESYDVWLKTVNMQTCMNDFMLELSQYLNLKTGTAFLVLSNYIMFEYYGKMKEFCELIRDGNTIRLKETIWNFYTSERMFLLKILKHILEYVNNDDYRFAEKYKQLLKSIDIEQLQNNLTNQLNILLNEISPGKKNYNERFIKNWVFRNNRERIEVLMLIILAYEYSVLSPCQIIDLVKVFLESNFGTQSTYFHKRPITNNQDLKEFAYATNGCFLTIFQKYWSKNKNAELHKVITKEVDKDLWKLALNYSHTVVLIVWVLIKSVKSEEKYFEHYYYVDMQMRKKALPFLEELLSSNIYKNCFTGKIVLEATQKMLVQLYFFYANNKEFYELEGLIPVFIKVLSNKTLAQNCSQSNCGLDSIIEISIDTFPYDFFGLTKISEILLTHKTLYANIYQMLIKLPSFMSNMKWGGLSRKISVLTSEQSAIDGCDLIMLPTNTIVKSYDIFGKILVQYKGTSYNYFKYLEYLVSLLMAGSVYKVDEILVDKVVAGYGIIVKVIKHCKDINLESIGLDVMIMKLEKLIFYFDKQLNFKLIRLFYQIYYARIKHREIDYLQKCPEFIYNVFFPKIAPQYRETDVSKLLLNFTLFEENVFTKIFREIEYHEDHKLLLLYINILKIIVKTSQSHRNFQFAGVTYLLNHVFIQHYNWVFNDDNQKTKIVLGCLQIFHSILQRDPTIMAKHEQKIYNICLVAFLDNSVFVEAFIKLFVREKYHLFDLMDREVNWQAGRSLARLECIRMQLALLLILMNLKKQRQTKTRFDLKLPIIVKPIASYFMNCYSPVVAELSCRFLEKLAQDKDVPMLALLEFDHYQVQTLFLEKLRDPLEDENVKIVIIDLINTCISNQNGMTAAFFDLECFMYWDTNDNNVQIIGNSIREFMIDYLENVKRSLDYFKNPLQLGILKLVANLWIKRREKLIKKITGVRDFWAVMFDPFFHEFKQYLEVYITVLRIVNLELKSHLNEPNDKLLDILNKFLKNKQQLKMWSEFLLKIATIGAESREFQSSDLLRTWIEFFVLTKRILPENYDGDTRLGMMLNCLHGWGGPCNVNDNVEIFYCWSRLYLLLIAAWPKLHKSKEKIIVTNLTSIFQAMNKNLYRYLPANYREIILCIINRTLVEMRNYLSDNLQLLLPLLNEIGLIVDFEYQFFQNEDWKDDDGSTVLKCWTMIILIGISILKLKNVDTLPVWFAYREFLPRVVNSFVSIVKYQYSLSFAKLAMQFMILYAESAMVKDFLNIDFRDFYYNIRPPELTIDFVTANQTTFPIHLKEWWLIFTQLAKLNHILLARLNGIVLGHCFNFVLQLDGSLTEILTLVKYTVDMTALTCVCETLKFINVLLTWKHEWEKEAQYPYFAIMEAAKVTMNACILSIIGSRKIHLFEINDENKLNIINDTPIECLSNIINKLIEVILWLSSCLTKFKPSLHQLLDVPLPKENIYLLVDIDFSVPRFELPISERLTYGKLLCLAHYLCRVINHLSINSALSTNVKGIVSMLDLPDHIRLRSINRIFEHCTATFNECTAFMVYLQRPEDVVNEKLSSFLHYDVSDYSGTSSSSSVITRLNYRNVKCALELLMAFMSGEIMVNLRVLRQDKLNSYKRELCSEIQFFYEFVRKRTSEHYAQALVGSPRAIIHNETDLIKRYMFAKSQSVNDVADNNFVLVLWQLLANFCDLSN